MNVGDYVRTKRDGIGKIISFSYNEDDECCFVELANRRTGIKEYNIIKSSPQIIDLIEVGDYVNGYLVIEEPYTYHDVTFISVDTQDSWGWGKGEMPIENIKTIVTHEQMAAIQYRVEE